MCPGVCVCVRESLCFFSHDGFKFPLFCREINPGIQYGVLQYFTSTLGVSPAFHRCQEINALFFNKHLFQPKLSSTLAAGRPGNILVLQLEKQKQFKYFFFVFNPFRVRPAGSHVARQTSQDLEVKNGFPFVFKQGIVVFPLKSKAEAETNLPCSGWFCVYTLIDVRLGKCFKMYKAFGFGWEHIKTEGKKKLVF